MWTTRRCLGRVCSVWPDDFRANYTIRWFFCYRLEGHDLLNNMLRRLYCLKNKWMKRQELVRFICFRMRVVKKNGVFANIKKNVLILVAEFLTSLSLMPVDFCSLLSSWVEKNKMTTLQDFLLDVWEKNVDGEDTLEIFQDSLCWLWISVMTFILLLFQEAQARSCGKQVSWMSWNWEEGNLLMRNKITYQFLVMPGAPFSIYTLFNLNSSRDK